MKKSKIARIGGVKEKAQHQEPVIASAPGRAMNPADALSELQIRVALIRREWPNDAGMQAYRMALEMAAVALAEKYGIEYKS